MILKIAVSADGHTDMRVLSWWTLSFIIIFSSAIALLYALNPIIVQSLFRDATVVDTDTLHTADSVRLWVTDNCAFVEYGVKFRVLDVSTGKAEAWISAIDGSQRLDLSEQENAVVAERPCNNITVSIYKALNPVFEPTKNKYCRAPTRSNNTHAAVPAVDFRFNEASQIYCIFTIDASAVMRQVDFDEFEFVFEADMESHQTTDPKTATRVEIEVPRSAIITYHTKDDNPLDYATYETSNKVGYCKGSACVPEEALFEMAFSILVRDRTLSDLKNAILILGAAVMGLGLSLIAELLLQRPQYRE